MQEDLGICHEVRKLREGALPYWRPMQEARTEERAFLDGDRYEDNYGTYNRDRRKQQFRGQETSNVNRNKVAQATSAPRSLEALPVDKLTDPDDAETAVSILTWEQEHPQKGFDDVLEEVIQDAVDCRAGAAILDYDPDMGEFGETYWRWKEANLLIWEPGFSDPHHLKCGWFQEARLMLISDIEANGKIKGKAKWHGTDNIKADTQALTERQGATNPDGSPRLDAWNNMGVPGVPTDDLHAWVLFTWFKNDPSTIKRQKEERMIPEEDRYIACDNPDCAYREQTQGELIKQGEMEQGDTLPDVGEACPVCGSPTSRRDVHAKEQDVLAYPKGRRLVIQPLIQVLPDDEPFYDGAWPIPTARSFPLLWITAYVRPGRPMGPSDTTLNWEAQIASDQLLTMAFDRIMRHQMYYFMPSVGINDANGNRFEFRDDQYNVMFGDNSDPNRPMPQVQLIQGSALDNAWPAYWNAVQTTLLGHQGINDMGMTPDSSKDIAVGTVERLNQIGNIPIAHFIRRKNRAISKACGVHWDYLRATYGPDRLARLKLGDEDLVVSLKGDELPNFDFIFAEAPDFSGIDKARSEAFQTLYAMVQQNPDPEWLDLFAEVNHFPPSIVRKVKRKLAKDAAMMQQAQEQAMMSQQGAPQEQGPPQGADIQSLLQGGMQQAA